MKTEMELQVQAYLDNELDPREAQQVAEEISRDPETRALYDLLRDTKEILQTTGEQPLRLTDNRDFYWSKIQRQIEVEETASITRPAPRPWWLKLMVPVSGAIALFAVLLSIVPDRTPTLSSSGVLLGPDLPPPAPHRIESTSPEVSTVTFRSESEGITVVWISTE